MPIVYFVRHGQTDWNAELRFQGQLDVPINKLGHEQARRNGARLNELIAEPAGFRFIASPLGRARETMQIVRNAMNLEPELYDIDDALIEVNYGDWEGSTLAEIETRQPELEMTRQSDKWNFVPPGVHGESYAMQARRFEPWLDDLSGPTVCVAHGGILRCVWKLRGGLTDTEAGDLVIPQDRILVMESSRLEWV